MGNSLGRGGRRRRVLNEEIAASASHAVRDKHAVSPSGSQAPNYAAAASAENHPRISDFTPRHVRSIWLATLLGLVCVAGLATLDFYQDAIAQLLSVTTLPTINLAAAGSVASWFASVVLLLTATQCALVYALRRHKLSDFRGRYRTWLPTAAVCLMLSMNAVTGLHQQAADLAASLAGWSALRENAVWWLVPAGLVLGWCGFRALCDMRESRLATFMFTCTLATAAVALVTHLQLVPASALTPPLAEFVSRTAWLLTCVLLMAAVVSYSRFVLLDADGLVPASRTSKRTRASAGETGANNDKPQRGSKTSSDQQTSGRAKRTTPAAAAAMRDAKKTEWIDGSTPEADQYYDDEPHQGRRKLSKSERKRLRKQKAQRRAA